MARTGSVVTGLFAGFLKDPRTGLVPTVAGIAAETGITLTPIPPAHVIQQNTPVRLAERSTAVQYPVVHVYSNRTWNLLTEKFRMFSGKVGMVAEVRVSQDRIEGLEDQLRLYVDSITQVLD